jgi:hypothetical protein
MERVIVSDRGVSLNSPCMSNNILYYTSADTGDLYKVESAIPQIIVNTKGVPNSICFDNNGKMYICDFSHSALCMNLIV